MQWKFNDEDLTTNYKCQDQEFTPEEIAIIFVFYSVDQLAKRGEIKQESPLTDRMRTLIHQMIEADITPSRRQYHAACDASGRDRKLMEASLN